MTDQTVAILDPLHPRIIDTIRDRLPAGWTLSIAAGGSPEQQKAAIAPADLAFVMAAPMPRPLLEAAGRLRFIQKLGAGVDRIDTGYCAERDIAVARLHAGNAIPVAEHTLLLILAACRQLPRLDRRTREGAWGKEEARGVNRQVHGKTVGLIGFGAIGRQVARLLSGFDADLAYFDPVRADAATETALGVRYLALDDLLARADIVSLHLPLLPETAGLLDAARLRSMKRGAILVNCARGGLVDEEALAEALAAGHLFAAAIDAFAQEPPAGNPLLAMDATVVTPHCAGATIDNFASIADRAVANARRFLAGEALPPGDVVVPSRVPAAS